MKIIVTESQLKKIISEQIDPARAALGPQKCDLTKGGEDSNGKEERQWDKDIKKQGKIDAKQSQKELQDYINPRIDRLGYKIDKKDFNSKYTQFVTSNPDFESLPSKLSATQRFGILYKESGALKNDNYYLTMKLNKMFNRKGPITMEQFYDMIKQMGGFDKYYELWSIGFPTN